MIVENRLTPLEREEATNALAYQRLTGQAPSAKVLALLLAQSALETGHWKKIHNHNFGNAKAGPGYPLIVQFRCSEVDENGVETFYDPPDPHCNFRAYENAADGAVDYLKVLQRRPHWWQGLHTEDPSAFVDALATPPKYFTANPEKYKGTLVALYERFLPLALAELQPRPPPHQSQTNQGSSHQAPACPPASSTPRPSRPSRTGRRRLRRRAPRSWRYHRWALRRCRQALKSSALRYRTRTPLGTRPRRQLRRSPSRPQRRPVFRLPRNPLEAAGGGCARSLSCCAGCPTRFGGGCRDLQERDHRRAGARGRRGAHW